MKEEKEEHDRKIRKGCNKKRKRRETRNGLGKEENA